jgi:diadenylate cyclase
VRTFIESGVRLDGRLSRDVLASMFHPETALHDGAVIVQKDRIAAAACFLPLSTNPAISLKLGTRHRAGVGITEETDCLSIIVSEETGRVSVAAFGELVQGLSLPEVEERIHRHFGVQRPITAKIDEYAADIPLTVAAPPPAESNPADKVNQP